MKTPRFPIGRLVMLVWEDSVSETGWESDPREPNTAEVCTAGYIVHVTKRRVNMAGSNVRGRKLIRARHGERIAIPRGAVRHVLKLKVGKDVGR